MDIGSKDRPPVDPELRYKDTTPHTPMRVSSYSYICVLILLYVSSYHYVCPHATIYVSASYSIYLPLCLCSSCLDMHLNRVDTEPRIHDACVPSSRPASLSRRVC